MNKNLITTTLLAASLSSTLLHADEPANIDESVNKVIVSEGEIKSQNVENLKDAFDTTSGVETDGESLSIRGVGEDGRGIAVNDDGVSLTDVSGAFSTDIDTNELEKLVVYKGPGSIYAVNGTGGVLKANSRPVFKMDNNIKATAGSYGYRYLKLNAHNYFDIDNLINFTYSRKEADNDYKEHSTQQDDRYTLKHGTIIDNTSSLETSFKYIDSYKDKIQPVTDAGFQDYLNDDTITNDGLWIFNSRDVQTKTIDSKYKQYFGKNLLKINAFFSEKELTYYNDGKININDDNFNTGIDIEYDLSKGQHSLVLGSSFKKDQMSDNNQYTYGDITTTGPGVITSINGTALGDVLSTSNSSNYLIGVYAKDDYQIRENIKLETSLRIDSVNFDVDSTQYWQYNATQEKYIALPGDLIEASQDNTLITPRIALTYGLNSSTNTFISIAQGERSINDTELLVNIKNDKPTDINPAKSINYELGMKHSSDNWLAELSIYKNIISDEIIEVKDSTIALKYYENAGEIDKTGLELGFKYTFYDFYYIGANYSYMDYQYVSYVASTGDYSGNTLHSIPDYKYAIYAGFKNPVKKISAKIEVITSDSFYTDDANTRTYEGYEGVTNIIFGHELTSNQKLSVNVNNLFDKRYASDATYSSTTDLTTYVVAAPRTLKLSYTYNF
ncbi:MAG: TonB-dependent receptor [Gammaproteobacteria bacterium]|nr:TonB-dependent receptor [Gammaproteobacteria bacterium]